MRTLLTALLFSALTVYAADATGKWSGSFEIKTPEGETRNPSAYLVLKQDGNKLTGSGGPAEDRQEGSVAGTVEGNQLTFTVEHDGQAMNFKLQMDGDSMTGQVSREHPERGKETAKVSLKRVKD